MAILNTANLTSNFDNGSGEEISVSNSSNTLRTNNLDTDILVQKTASKTWAIASDTLTLTTTIVNNTDLNISDITIKDTLSDDATFVAGSLTIGSIPQPDYDPIAGFSAPVDISGSGGSVEICYQIQVAKYLTSDEITTQTTLSITLDTKKFDLTSQELQISILNNEIWIRKTADTSAVVSGEVLTYTITIQNSGNFKNTNLNFVDPIPDGTTFVDGSVKINNIEQPSYHPGTGFALDDLDPNDEIIIEFKVKIT